MSPEQIDAVRAAFRGVEAKISPLLRFNRTYAGRQETRLGGESFVAASAGEKREQ
jgi:hypothetical protein